MVDLLEVGDVIDLIATDPQGSGASVVASGVPVLAIPPADDSRPAQGQAGALVVVGAAPGRRDPAGRRRGAPVPDLRLLPLAWRAMSGFKNFLLRGNLVDLAVAVIIGVAFGAVVGGVHRLADRQRCPAPRRRSRAPRSASSASS